MRRIWPAVALLFLGCGTDPAALDGEWSFTEETCDGDGVALTGYRATVTIDGSKYTTTIEAGGCAATLKDATISSAGELVPGDGSVSCSPNPCTVSWSANGAPQQLQCPGDFPIAGIKTHVDIEDGALVIDGSVGGHECIARYTKR